MYNKFTRIRNILAQQQTFMKYIIIKTGNRQTDLYLFMSVLFLNKAHHLLYIVQMTLCYVIFDKCISLINY